MVVAVDTSGASPALLVAIAAGLIVLAVGLFFLEAIVPSFGLITLFGIGCIAGAIVLAFSVGTGIGVLFSVLAVASVPVAVALVVKMLKSTSFVLKPAEEPQRPTEGVAPWRPQPGTRGVAASPLRPAGTAVFDGRRVSVVTTGDMVEPDEQVEVVQVDGTRIVVRPVRL